MRRIILAEILVAAVIWLAFFHVTAAAAITTYHADYTIRQPISNKKAELDVYFNKPATVSIEENEHYRVTISIVTNHDLGSFPFQILRINGLLPKVEKKTLGQQDYYTFSFITQDIHQKIYGVLRADIDSSNYHYQGGFNLDLDARKIPTLAQISERKSLAPNANSSKKSTEESELVHSSSIETQQTAPDKQKTGENAKSSGQAQKSSSENTDNKAAVKEKANKENKKTNETGKILLAIGIVIALGIGGWGLLSNYRS